MEVSLSIQRAHTIPEIFLTYEIFEKMTAMSFNEGLKMFIGEKYFMPCNSEQYIGTIADQKLFFPK
jgi:hypothetical protein